MKNQKCLENKDEQVQGMKNKNKNMCTQEIRTAIKKHNRIKSCKLNKKCVKSMCYCAKSSKKSYNRY